MGVSLYDMTVPVYVRALRNLAAILAKGAAFAAARGIDPADLLTARLIHDMGPLPLHIQRASDAAKGTVVRVGGIENVVFEDNEETFDALQARIARTIAFLEKAPRAALDGREDAPVTLDLGEGRSIPFTGRSYVLAFALPNFFFHVTIAYALLRHRGAPIGKLDYLGGV